MLIDPGQHCFFPQIGGIQNDRVRRWLQRRIRASPITLIPLPQFRRNLFRQRTTNLLLQQPPFLANVRVGVQEYLQIRIRKNLGSNIAAFHHNAAARTEFALASHHPLPYFRMHRNFRSGIRHIRFAYTLRNVTIIEQDAIPRAGGFQRDTRVVRQIEERRFVVQIAVTIIALVIALSVVFGLIPASEDLKKIGFGLIGTIIGYWLK